MCQEDSRNEPLAHLCQEPDEEEVIF